MTNKLKMILCLMSHECSYLDDLDCLICSLIESIVACTLWMTTTFHFSTIFSMNSTLIRPALPSASASLPVLTFLL